MANENMDLEIKESVENTPVTEKSKRRTLDSVLTEAFSGPANISENITGRLKEAGITSIKKLKDADDGEIDQLVESAIRQEAHRLVGQISLGKSLTLELETVLTEQANHENIDYGSLFRRNNIDELARHLRMANGNKDIKSML